MPITSASEVSNSLIKENYWNFLLKGISPAILPYDYNTDFTKGEKTVVTLNLDSKFTEKLLNLCKINKTSSFYILVAAFRILICKYENASERCLTSTKLFYDEDDLLTFSNELLLVNEILNEDSFQTVLKKIKLSEQLAIDNHLPLEEIFGTATYDSGISKAIRQFLIIDNCEKSISADNDILNNALNNYELLILPIISKDTTSCSFIFKSNKHNEIAIHKITEHFENILKSIVSEPGLAAGRLNILSTNESNQLLYDFNNTNKEYPKTHTLFSFFEAQVLQTPDSPALIKGEHQLTYRQLNYLSNQLAHYLIRYGVKPSENIGLVATRSFEMIIIMMGILKAGGAYVPIDPEYPDDRKEYIISNSSVSIVLIDQKYNIENLSDGIKFINLNEIDTLNEPLHNPTLEIPSTQLAYTIYTSGSTGRPKGVMIEHHSAINLINWVNTEFNVDSKDRLLFITSMCFDLSVYDIFGILCSGGALVIADQSEINDIRRLQVLLKNYKITFWDSVPTTLDYMIREMESSGVLYLQTELRLVFLSGDWLPLKIADRTKKYFPNANVISLGGATEGTVWSNYFPIKKTDPSWKSIPYGRPIDNNYFYILNEYLQPVPIGIAGELYIGGIGVARGYANDSVKTENSFRKDPFNQTLGGRMYKTGDLGRMGTDMNMQFIGRKDNQIKIRGFRIELGEIESVIREIPEIDDVVVIAKDDKKNDKILVSYVVSKDYNEDALIEFLRNKVPDYMVPSLWINLQSLPLTSNGKIDKKSLPDFIEQTISKRELIKPRDHVEEQILEIWKSVLEVNDISTADNFFHLGGHSLLAVQIMTAIEKKIGHRLPLSVLYTNPTITSLYNLVTKESAIKRITTLVPIRAEGTKHPIYLIHGDGLNILNFSTLVSYLDKDQPVYGLEAKGLDGESTPLMGIENIAGDYVQDILFENPQGPYYLAGYSFGGYLAIEMRKQLIRLGKEVNMIALFDTDIDNYVYSKPGGKKFWKRFKRQLPKFLFISKSFLKRPLTTFLYQKGLLFKNVKKISTSLRLIKKEEPSEFFKKLHTIAEGYHLALKNYELEPFDAHIYLFKAKERFYYLDEPKFLGWKNYALKGVTIFDVPGNHKTIFEEPNVKELAKYLQHLLDECSGYNKKAQLSS